jgi:ABC-type lipoprotein release transport system permease subunit
VIVIALRDVWHDFLSALLNIIATGVLVFAFLLLISLAFTLTQFGTAQGPARNLLIIESDVLSPEQSELPITLKQTVSEVLDEQIERVDPLIFRIMGVDDLTVQLRGVTPAAWDSTFQLRLSDGDWPANENEILVDQVLAENPGWGVGSQVKIYGHLFDISGVSEGPGTVANTIWMSLNAASDLFQQSDTSELLVVNLNPDVDPIQARQRLQDQLNLSGHYDVYFEDTLLRRFAAAFRDLRSMSTLLTAIAFTAVTLGAHNQAWLAAEQRKVSLGVLRTIGFHRQRVEGYLLSRALIINFIAYFLAFAAASIFIQFGLERPLHSFGGTQLTLSIKHSTVILGFLLSSASALLGTWLSSRKSMSSSPAALLGRGQGSHQI